jgi:hypothetical protein
MSLLRRPLFVACGTLVLMASAASAQQAATKSSGLSAELQAVKASLEKYQDPIVAVREGFLSTQGCVGYSDGIMGVHFVNMGNVGPTVDPAKPPVLIYEPVNGKLVLVAAEWFVPLATGVKEAPSIFGQKLEGPMDGHEPILPKELTHYDLHVWLWKENPKGLFNTVNPAVKCGDYAYTYIHTEPSKAHSHN